ncbi:hypothetical protein EL23_19400 [Paenibacillus polymyxa]|nr:hypothetical protein EL23_19400 [Paenibacillus polymyxa]
MHYPFSIMLYPLPFTSDQLTLLIFCFLQDFFQGIYIRTEQAEWCWTSEAVALKLSAGKLASQA